MNEYIVQLNHLKEPYLLWPGHLLQLPPQGVDIDGATLKEETPTLATSPLEPTR
ncbi:MAG: hypothetical protein WCE49_02635 [Terrimicrobiaceae bacterium]